MQEFKIIDEKRYPLNIHQFNNKDLLPYYRFEHRVTVGYRGRRFIAFVDQMLGNVYIEEITEGQLNTIDDDSMFEALRTWIDEKGFFAIIQPIMKPVGYNI